MHTQLHHFRSASLRLFLAIALLFAVALQTPASVAGAQPPVVLYVDAGAPPGGDGASWATALDSLQAALAVAGAGTQVWLAAGVYRPSAETTPGDPRSATFTITPGVSLYGGFDPAAGLDTWEERNPAALRTVLNGDLDGNDVDPDGDGIIESWQDLVGGNAYHVMYLDGAGGAPLGRDTVLDGLVITGGLAEEPGARVQGGGIYCAAAWGECSPSLSNLVIVGNRATSGGGMYNDGTSGVNSSLLAHVTFRGNYAGHDGGGLFNNGIYSGDSSPLLVDVTFEANVAGQAGGGMVNYGYQGTSDPTLINVSFYGNRAGTWGGGIFSCGYYGGTSNMTLVNGVFVGNQATWGGGGVHNSTYGGSSSHTITNTTFVANHAERGGGLFSENELATQHLALSNAILWGNSATLAGAQAFNGNATVEISHSDIEGSGGSAAWDVALGTDQGGNLDQDPSFLRVPDPGDGDWTTPADNDYGDLRLGSPSPAVDAGDNAALPPDTHDVDGDGNVAEVLPVDRDGNPRLAAGSDGLPAVVDMGAYEVAAAAQADLSLEATVSQVSARAGDTLVYRFTIVNHGPDDASQVVLVDSLSPAASFQAASPGCLEAGGEVTCGPAALPAAMGTTYHVTVTLAVVGADSLVNTASVSAAEPDPDPTNNVVTVTTQIGTLQFLLYLPVVVVGQ